MLGLKLSGKFSPKWYLSEDIFVQTSFYDDAFPRYTIMVVLYYV